MGEIAHGEIATVDVSDHNHVGRKYGDPRQRWSRAGEPVGKEGGLGAAGFMVAETAENPIYWVMYPVETQPKMASRPATETQRERKAPRVQLKPNLRKIVAAISYVIALGELRKLDVTYYVVLKTLFVADRSHLNKYGRPVTFDNYSAMRAGPVPSMAYDILKEQEPALRKLRSVGITTLPWTKTARERGIPDLYSHADTRHIDDVLSPSDKDALQDALSTIAGLTFVQIKKLTHADPAYEEAWEDDSEKKSFAMSLGLFFDTPDFEEAEALEFQSKHL